MAFPNTVPIPGFAGAIPIPLSQANLSNSGTSHGPSSRKSRDNQNGVFNPPCRFFNIPVATQDYAMHEKIRKILHYRDSEQPQIEMKVEVGFDIAPNANSLNQQSQSRLELNVKELARLSNEAKITLKEVEEKATESKKGLNAVVSKRDHQLKAAESASIDLCREDKRVQGMKQQKDDLMTTIRLMDDQMKDVEEIWNKEKNILKESEECKRKASEQIEDQRRKKQSNAEPDASESQQLEKELKEKEKELEQINQNQSQMIWFMKQVIKLENDQKEKLSTF